MFLFKRSVWEITEIRGFKTSISKKKFFSSLQGNTELVLNLESGHNVTVKSQGLSLLTCRALVIYRNIPLSTVRLSLPSLLLPRTVCLLNQHSCQQTRTSPNSVFMCSPNIYTMSITLQPVAVVGACDTALDNNSHHCRYSINWD